MSCCRCSTFAWCRTLLAAPAAHRPGARAGISKLCIRGCGSLVTSSNAAFLRMQPCHSMLHTTLALRAAPPLHHATVAGMQRCMKAWCAAASSRSADVIKLDNQLAVELEWIKAMRQRAAQQCSKQVRVVGASVASVLYIRCPAPWAND